MIRRGSRWRQAVIAPGSTPKEPLAQHQRLHGGGGMTDNLLPGEQPQGEGQLPDLAVLNALCPEREAS